MIHQLHIILKFTLHSWQVPRSSVGRALYRESGPSQDGDPVPGNLPFSFLFFFSFCLIYDLFGDDSFLFPLFPTLWVIWIVFVRLSIAIYYIGECFLPTIGRVSPFPSLSHSGHASIETLLHLNIIKLNNKIIRFPQSFWALVPCSKYSNCYI